MPSVTLDPPEPPRPGGDLFKPDVDWWHNAVLDRFRPSWYAYAEGYRRAAETLIRQLSSDRRGKDFMIYPILFLYRQYLELSLKLMIADAEEILSLDGTRPYTHNLSALWARCRVGLRKAAEVPESELRIIENAVEQFSEADPSSEAFRYPVQRDGSPVTHPKSHVNLRVLLEEMTNAANVIEASSNYLSVLVDQHREFAREYGP